MPITPAERKVVDQLFAAMQAGPAGEDALLALFADDGVLIEPFTGVPREHHGKAAVRQAFRESWSEPPPPGMELTLDRAERDGDRIRADWTCTAPVFPAPMKGYDLFTVRDGRIVRLEVVVTDGAPGGPHEGGGA